MIVLIKQSHAILFLKKGIVHMVLDAIFLIRLKVNKISKNVKNRVREYLEDITKF